MVDGGLSAAAAGSLFQLPCISSLVMLESRVVVAFVKIFKDRGKNLREFFREVHSFRRGFEELTAADGSEER